MKRLAAGETMMAVARTMAWTSQPSADCNPSAPSPRRGFFGHPSYRRKARTSAPDLGEGAFGRLFFRRWPTSGEPDTAGRRYVDMPDEYAIKLRIDAALKDHHVRMASLIAGTIHSSIELIEEQPPAVLEALADFCGELQRNEERLRPELKGIRLAYIEFMKYALKEARRRERRLLSGLTGVPEIEEVEHHPQIR